MSVSVGGRRVRHAVIAAGVAAGLLLAGVSTTAAHAAPIVGTEVVTRAATVPANGGVSIVVWCPSGKTVTGGGFSIPQPALADTLQVRASAPVPSGGAWRVYVRSIDPLPRTVTAYAVCSSGPARTYVSNTFTVPALSHANGTVTCPSGSRAIGGGFEAGEASGALAGANVSRPATTNTWTARIVNAATYQRSATVWAVCGTNLSGFEYVGQSQTVAPGESYNLFPQCSSGRVPTSGGFYHGGTPLHVWASIPVLTNRSWSLSYRVPGIAQTSFVILAFAVCFTGT